MNESYEIKILLVDDREDNLLSIQSVLERDKYSFRKANSGDQALKILLKELDFTLILMDVHMPNLNGFETAALIYEREKLKHIPIIFITANNNDNNAFKGYQSGAVDYIYKPINPDLLRAKVAVFVDLYRKTHQLLTQERKLLEINNELEERVNKRTEELFKKNSELEVKNVELSRVNNDLDNFVYTASHDLKSPVANIEGLVNLIKEELEMPVLKVADLTSLVNMIDQSLLRFKKTIGDLTDITKIQKDSGSEEAETINIQEIISDIKMDIEAVIKESSAVINVELDTFPEINFSRKNFKSIMYNLISNAIKYKDYKRSPEILIKSIQENGYLVITISDNGLGMDLSKDIQIFSMFKRLHDHVEGTGIGLYLVKRIIDNAGGKIEVESKVGKGTTFKLYFRL